MESLANSNQYAILLWDGTCGFCKKCIEWVEKRDIEKQIKTIPYQEVSSPPMTNELRSRCTRSIQLFISGRHTLSGGRAALLVLSLLGWRKTAAFLAIPPFIWAVQGGYRIVARNRTLFSRLIFTKSD